MPWSAFGEPGRGQPAPPNQAVLAEGVDRVLAAGRHEATGRRAQRRHHMPVQLDQENQSPRAGPADRAQPRRRAHGLGPAADSRRKHRRSSSSSRDEDAVRLLGSARITNRSDRPRSPSRFRATCRSRRATRCRSTADPTALLTTSPTRGAAASSPSDPRRRCTTTSGCAIRIPCLTAASKSIDRVMRLRAGSTAEKPGAAIRQIARGGPCGADRTRSRARHECACATGSHARGLGAGYSAGRSACPWPRRSPRCVAIRPLRRFASGSSAVRPEVVLVLLAGAVPRWFGSQPYRRLSGDCLRVLTSLRLVKPGLAQRSRRPAPEKDSPFRSRSPRAWLPYEPDQAPRTLNDLIGMQQNGWQPNGKLLASAKSF